MMKLKLVLGLLSSILYYSHSFALSVPDPNLTPGVLCSASDPDFSAYDYPEKIARCNRNIGDPQKAEVAAKYGNIPKSQWGQYEFDHLIPLCAGGSNNLKNLWPQPINEAREKDVLEVDICTGLKAGTITQVAAVQKVHDWFASHATLLEVIPFDETTSLSISVRKCEEIDHQEATPISVDYEMINQNEIRNLKIYYADNDKDPEIEGSGDKILTGKESRAAKGPLQGYLLYSLKEGKDSYDVYLPKDTSKDSKAYLKISFDGTYPKLVPLSCK